MNNMSNLYRQVIMDHYKSPRNKGLTGSGKQNHLRNPSCGDDITVEVEIENNKIKHLHHDGTGCSICCSSASVMSEVLTGKDVEEAKNIINHLTEIFKIKTIEKQIKAPAEKTNQYKTTDISDKVIEEIKEKWLWVFLF